MQVQTLEGTRELLRPKQVEEAQSELKRMERMIAHPDVQDRAAMQQQINRQKATLAQDTPLPFTGLELDKAVREEADLRDKLVSRMLTQEEMRRMPKDAPFRELRFQNENKRDIFRWKYLRRRLHAGSPDPNVSNLELYRPRSKAPETVEGVVAHKDFHGLAANPTPGAIMTEPEREVLKAEFPELAERMALLSGEERAAVLELVRKMTTPAEPVALAEPEPAPKPARKKRQSSMTPEERKAFGAKMAAARKAAREAKINGTHR